MKSPKLIVLLTLPALFGLSAVAQANPFTFEFEMPAWDFTTAPAIFGTHATLDLTFDNGAGTDLNQTYLNTQITQVSVATDSGGAFPAQTWTSGFQAFPGDSFVSTDGNGVATLDLLAASSDTGRGFFVLIGGFAVVQLGIIGPQSGLTTFFLSDGVNGPFAEAVPQVDGQFTGFTVISSSPASVPEPATLALMGLGLVGLGLSRHRKSAQVAA